MVHFVRNKLQDTISTVGNLQAVLAYVVELGRCRFLESVSVFLNVGSVFGFSKKPRFRFRFFYYNVNLLVFL